MSAANKTVDSDHRFRLLAIHAHPDDESSKGAATMARYAAEGHKVRVLTCTGGEMGSVLNPQMDRPEVWDNIVEVRREEMAKAADILGVEHQWLGYEDSGLPEGDPMPELPEGCFARQDVDDVAASMVKVIREFRPHVIITYDENGGYPHPDHIMVHKASMRAWDLAGDANFREDLGDAWAPLKIYYTHGFVGKRFNELFDEMSAMHDAGEISDEQFADLEDALSFWRRVPDIYPRVSTQVPAADWFAARDEALKAHATQIDPNGRFFSVPLEVQKKVWPTEEFELAKTRVTTTLPENDLFAGLKSTDEADKLAEDSAEELPIGSGH